MPNILATFPDTRKIPDNFRPAREPTTFFDAVRSNADAAFNVYRAGAREEAARADDWRAHLAAEKAMGKILPRSAFMQEGGQVLIPGTTEFIDVSDPTGERAWSEAEQLRVSQIGGLDEAEYDARMDRLRAEQPKAMAGIPTRQERLKALDQRLRAKAARASETAEDHPIGAFVGMAGGTLADPINAAATIYTGGLGAGRSILTRMAIQGGANAVVEGVQQPYKAGEAQRFGGPEWTPAGAVADVGFAGAGAAGFELGGHVLGKIARRLLPAPQTAAARAVQHMEDIERMDTALAAASGEEQAVAMAAISRGEIPPLTPARDVESLFADAAPGEPARAEYRGRAIWSQRYDPNQLDVAPELFQYKADGDAEGVTARLRGVEAWDPTSSGKIIVFETRDGRRLVADGHQRRALARRMDAKGFDATMDGFTFREADGWSAPEVRVVAALKNIREGSGTILDAAKILRTAAKAMDDGSLPVTGEFIGQARGLSRLSDEAFGAVVNKVIPERYGAEIGLMAANRPDLHEGMVRLLKEMDPANGDEARAMIAEALQDDWVKTQGETADLFGHDPAMSTMIARAKLAAFAQRSLAKDARLYNQLVKHADAIEAGGNALARDANEAKLALDRAAMGVTARLSMRSGPIGEAMAEAAQRVAKGEKVADAGRGVVARIRKALEDGEDLDAARGAAIDPAAPSPAARSLAEPFDDPNGQGAQGLANAKPEEAEFEANPPPGLFDDLPEAGTYERAHKALLACAPG